MRRHRSYLPDGSSRSGSWNMSTTNYTMALLRLRPLLLFTSICLMERGGLQRGICLLRTIHTLCHIHWIRDAPIHIGRYSHYRFWSPFSKWPIRWHNICEKNYQRRFNRGASQRRQCARRGPTEVRGPWGDPHHRAASPSPELNHWVDSADTHMSAPRDWCSRKTHSIWSARVLIKLAEGFKWQHPVLQS